MNRVRKYRNRVVSMVKSNEGKTLLTNFVALSILQVASYVFPIFTIPYLANIIGVDLYGELAFASAIMVYFQTVVDYGFMYSSVRDIARCKDDLPQINRIYSNVMWSRLVLTLLSLLILSILIICVPKFYDIKIVLYVSFLTVIGQAIFPDWIFQALERMKFITIFNVLIKFIFTISIFIFIKGKEDYILQPLLYSFGYITSGIGALYLIHKWGIRMHRPIWSEIMKSLRINFDLFINQIVPNLYNSLSVLLLGFFHGNSANGVFDAANRLNAVGVSCFSVFSRTFYPFLSRRIDKHKFYALLNISVAIILATVLFISAPFIINRFFPSSFKASIIVLRIVSISLIFLAMINIYGTNYLIVAGYEKLQRRITVYASIIGLFIGLPLVYFYSYIGVAITLLISRGLMGTLCFIYSKKLQLAK